MRFFLGMFYSRIDEATNYTLSIIFVRRDDVLDVDSAESIYKGKHFQF